jgi:hypothetical protein
MSNWLASWAGDNAGPVVGRQNNRLLVSLTTQDGTIPSGLFQQNSTVFGTPWFFELYVNNLAPGSRDAIAIACDDLSYGFAWSIEVAEVDYGLGKAPWQPGVNLFSVLLFAPGGVASATIATTTVDDKVTRIDFSQQPQFVASLALRPRPR